MKRDQTRRIAVMFGDVLKAVRGNPVAEEAVRLLAQRSAEILLEGERAGSEEWERFYIAAGLRAGSAAEIGPRRWEEGGGGA